MQTGWIKLYREITDHWVYQDAEYLRAWICILLQVNHKPNKIIIRKEVFECDCGESYNSLDTWSKLFGNWSTGKTRRFLKRLKDDGMIETKSVTKTTHLSVCNYKTYQSGEQADGTPNDTQTVHQTTRPRYTNKNDKNEKNVNNEKKKIERSKFSPPSLQEVESYAKEKGFESFDCQMYFDSREASGWSQANGRKLKDWKADVRVWERKGYAKKKIDLLGDL